MVPFQVYETPVKLRTPTNFSKLEESLQKEFATPPRRKTPGKTGKFNEYYSFIPSNLLQPSKFPSPSTEGNSGFRLSAIEGNRLLPAKEIRESLPSHNVESRSLLLYKIGEPPPEGSLDTSAGFHLLRICCFPALLFREFPALLHAQLRLLQAAAEKEHNMHEPSDTRSLCPPLKFQTACGRSISFSADALKRARNLLNELELDALEGEAKANPSTYSSVENDKIYNESSCNVKRISSGISLSVKQFCSPLMAPTPSRMIRGSRAARGVLVDISNYPGSSLKNKSWIDGEKKRLGKESSSSSFKRPRTSRFTAPLNHSSSSLAETAMPSSSVNCCCRARVSSRYPFQVKRKKLKEFFGAPPGRVSKFENIPDRIRFMTPDSAEKYRFHDTCSSVEFGPDAFREMLVNSGALLADTSEK
ncbi:protein BREAST CANCER SUSCEPTIBILITY 2 homolog B-like [Phalaenopsis equestris]|uniref:protein BREAST CANCER SUSCEPTIBILITY 2 homolog B-like n=1 Tax=Phalaenopsis equestris TaxID=78828 RepID=UPI0009E246A3|nr:protein BREAST CANCER SUSCEPTIBILITY 2 homolog B-like [Phalaenopsis equestris]